MRVPSRTAPSANPPNEVGQKLKISSWFTNAVRPSGRRSTTVSVVSLGTARLRQTSNLGTRFSNCGGELVRLTEIA